MPEPEDSIVGCFDAGYVASGMVANWLVHVRDVGLADRVLLVPFDRDAAAFARGSGFAWFEPYADDEPTRAGVTLFGEPELKAICFKRMETVHLLLKQGTPLLFTDLDLVFLGDPMPTLRGIDADLVIQSDVPPHGRFRHPGPRWLFGLGRRGGHTVNSGFYYVRPSARTVRLFDPRRPDWDDFRYDQDLLHDRAVMRREARHALLPGPQFPNGARIAEAVWRGGRAALDGAMILHFNWCSGDRKTELMRELGVWRPDELSTPAVGPPGGAGVAR